MGAYEEFLEAKRRHDPPTGISEVPELPDALFPFQRDIVRWALRRGRAAVFANTGMGKSFIELAWGQAIHVSTGGNVLLLTPLAVAGQMVREASYWRQAVANMQAISDRLMADLLEDAA